MRFLTVCLLAILATVAPGQNSKLTVPKAGKVEVRHGAVRFRADLYEQARPGTNWRMGSNGPTFVETTAALVWDKGVVFPGRYDLNARMVSDERWDLVFHRDGIRWGGKGNFGLFPLERKQMEDKRLHTDSLEVAFEKSRDKAARKHGGIEFHIRFGPHDATAPLRAIATGKLKGKVEKVGVQLEVVKLPLLPEFEKLFGKEDADNMAVARLTHRSNQEGIRLVIEPGETPRLRLLELNRAVDGTRKEVSSNAKTLKPSLKNDVLTLQLGKIELSFPLTATTLQETQGGGSTGGR